MGCNNSHLRPFFRRCRRRSKKDDSNCTPKRQPNDLMMIDGNHIDANSSSNDLLHGIQFIGSSLRNPPVTSKQASSESSDAPSCVPLLAQSEISHSQIDFFKMLDEKIQQGPDYDSDEDRLEMDRAKQRNIDTWRKTVGFTSRSEYIRVPTSSKVHSSRCQWDDDGDGG